MPTNPKEYMRKYYDENREKIKEKQIETKYCDICRTSVRKHHYNRHTKTKKHLDRINNNITEKLEGSGISLNDEDKQILKDIINTIV